LDDLDIWRTATLMMERFGADATIEAAMKADLMSEKGDRVGRRVWLSVLRAIHVDQGLLPAGA
jgi:hypothetical protein